MKILLASILLFAFAFAQPDTETNYDAYAGGHISTIYVLPVFGGHVGAKNLLADNIGVRFDLETVLPLSFIAGVPPTVFGAGLNAMYHFDSDTQFSTYLGAGPRAFFGFDPNGGGGGAFFGVGAIAGFELELDSLGLYFEFEADSFFTGPSIFVPVWRIGLNFPF